MGKSKLVSVYASGFPIAVSHQFPSFERDGRRRSDSSTAETVMNHHMYVLQLVRCDYIPKWIHIFFPLEIIWPTQIGLAIERTYDSCMTDCLHFFLPFILFLLTTPIFRIIFFASAVVADLGGYDAIAICTHSEGRLVQKVHNRLVNTARTKHVRLCEYCTSMMKAHIKHRMPFEIITSSWHRSIM